MKENEAIEYYSIMIKKMNKYFQRSTFLLKIGQNFKENSKNGTILNLFERENR